MVEKKGEAIAGESKGNRDSNESEKLSLCVIIDGIN